VINFWPSFLEGIERNFVVSCVSEKNIKLGTEPHSISLLIFFCKGRKILWRWDKKEKKNCCWHGLKGEAEQLYRIP